MISLRLHPSFTPNWRKPDSVLCYICKHSKSYNSKDKARSIRRLHEENFLLFGKLQESSAEKRKRLKRMESNFEESAVDSARLVEKIASHSSRKEFKLKGVTDQKSVVKGSSKKPIHVDTSKCDLRAKTVDDSQIPSSSYLNPRKKKYIIDGNNSKIERIRKLLTYHPGYKSVSEILSKSMSKQSEMNLDRWKTRMISELGEEGFQSHSQKRILLGSTFRKHILKYLSGVPENDLEIDDELKNYWSSAKAVFPIFQHIVDCEGLVAHPDLKYKGVFDCLAVFRKEVMLVSWKKSDRYAASLDRTYDIPLQIAAYMGALNFDDRYPFRVEQALLVMAYNNGSKADLFHLNSEKCAHYWKKWLGRYETYLKRIEEEGEQRKNAAEVETLVPSGSESDSEKIDVDNELEDVASRIQFSPRIINESTEEVKEDEVLENVASLHPLINTHKVNYDHSERMRIEPSIEYQSNSYPSVSTILSDTKTDASNHILEQWRRSMIEKLGQEGFEKYERETLEAGSTLHEYLRRRFSEGFGESEEIPQNIEGFWRSLSSVFPLISNIQVTEATVAHPVCKYRGIIDCIGFYQNKLVLIDWKTSEKTKTCVSRTYDAPLQIAAYLGAVNFDPSYPFKVEEGLIVVVYSDGTEASVFHLDKEKCLKYWWRWLGRLNKYQTMAYENALAAVQNSRFLIISTSQYRESSENISVVSPETRNEDSLLIEPVV